MAPLTKRLLKISVLLYFVSQFFFLVNIQFPRKHSFDEFHYVPSAQEFLAQKENRNYEHPPLAKELMAVGIATWGDRPIGWRFMSTVFGSLTLVGMFLWAFALFKDENIALWVAALTCVNQLLYVQARIGMLDTFMFAFIAFAMAAFAAAWDPDQDPRWTRRFFIFTGVCLGLATATKWFAIIPWTFCIGLVILVRLFQHWNVRFENNSNEDWYSPELWKTIRVRELFIYLGIIPLIFYYLPFLPTHFQKESPHSFWDILFEMQLKMWDGQSRVVGSHPYHSLWKEWALMIRPIWYAFDKEESNDSLVRGVLLIGNPLVMWTGLGAIIACVMGWIKDRRRDAMLIGLTYLALYFSWMVIPRKVSFYYYYYPAGMTLSLALAYVFHRFETAPKKWFRIGYLVIAAGLFIYFFPILAALKIPSNSYVRYTWFSSWI